MSKELEQLKLRVGVLERRVDFLEKGEKDPIPQPEDEQDAAQMGLF